jgi:hypothetical protein
VFYFFLLILAALAVGIYLLFFLQNVPGAAEERIGVLEPLPTNLGEWQEETTGPEAERALAQGRRREVRTYFDEAKNVLLKQVRYRDGNSGEIVGSEPDEVIKRRRVTR